MSRGVIGGGLTKLGTRRTQFTFDRIDKTNPTSIIQVPTQKQQRMFEKGLPNMIPQQWTPPCNSQCTHKFSLLTQIPWRVFCKKGCDADGDTWEECQSECDEICFKDPVIAGQSWSAVIDRSPGSATYSEDCFHACVAGCGYKFEIPTEEVNKIHPNRPPPPTVVKPPPPDKGSRPPREPGTGADALETSA